MVSVGGPTGWWSHWLVAPLGGGVGTVLPMEEFDGRPMRRAVADYPARKARTMRFTCGAPRSARILGDGSRMVFLRSGDPEDRVCSLWLSVIDDHGGHEILLADPRVLLDGLGAEDVPAEERARRERAREGGAGIVSYDADAAGERVVFALGGHVFMVGAGGRCRGGRNQERDRGGRSHDDCGRAGQECTDPVILDAQVASGPEWTPILNPRISPDGRHVLYSTGRRLVLLDVDDRMRVIVRSAVLPLPDDAPDTRTVGLAEFVAGEEMDRYDGFWWSPDSRHVLVEDFDSAQEPVWYMSAPADPEAAQTARRYPRALTHNAVVHLTMVDLAVGGDGAATPRESHPVRWDANSYEYLAAVNWTGSFDPVILVQNRRQNRDQVRAVRPDGSTTLLEGHENPQWLDLIPGTPARTPDGRLICAMNDMESDTNRLTLDGVPFTPEGWQIRELLDVGESDVLVVVQRTAREGVGVCGPWADDADRHDARSMDVATVDYADGRPGTVLPVSSRPGVWTASRHGDGMVLSGRDMEHPKSSMVHTLTRVDPSGLTAVHAPIANHCATPGFVPTTTFTRLGRHRLIAAITRPSADSPYAAATSLPVLMRPYGGPGFQQAVFSQAYHWDSQWWADQGFLVVTADGRGTTGRGPLWDREIVDDMKNVTLADQIEAVRALPQAAPEADLDRVAIIGWSYGGFLSALAVIDAPEVFHAACAGAPPTDWTLYDTHYTERYLGLDPEVYRRNGIIEDAPRLRRPLMLIHGFADDNVTIAHSLRLSQALMAAGRPHTFLPLSGITHMTNDETVARNLLILQRDFLRDALGVGVGVGGDVDVPDGRGGES